MGFSDSIAADPFGRVDFANRFIQFSGLTANTLTVKNFDGSDYGPDVDVSFLVNDRGLTVPIIVYPRYTSREAEYFENLSSECRRARGVGAVYYSPTPLRMPAPSLAMTQQMPILNTESLLARVIPADFMSGPATQESLIVCRVYETGLVEALVLDTETTMTFVNMEWLQKLGQDVDGAFVFARRNLRTKLQGNLPDMLFEKNMMYSFNLGDSFDAARIPALPKMLKEGQIPAAVILDRDTLVLLPVSEDKDNDVFWNSLTVFPAGSTHRIHDRTLQVSRAGIELRQLTPRQLTMQSC